MEEERASLYLIATPIGNMEDISFRAIRLLSELTALACEDTRKTRLIFERYELARPRTLFSYHDHNEDFAGKRILGLLKEGVSVGLCTDGGYPGISDPGYRLLAACEEEGYPIEVIPGASAVPVALLASGLPTSSYTFKGFPPRKSGARQRFFGQEKDLPHTLICFESPYRVGKSLQDAAVVLGDRKAAVCIELTKKFQRVERGYLGDLTPLFLDKKIKGEVTIVIAGNHEKFVRHADNTDSSPCAG